MFGRLKQSILSLAKDFVPQPVPDSLAFCEFECREWRCPRTGEVCPHHPDKSDAQPAPLTDGAAGRSWGLQRHQD